ncbi:MAG: multiple sugar transport system ATP-binding protein [Micromonosporaceae bacterium]
MAEIRLRNLVKVYPGQQNPATDNVSLDVADGEFLVLLGPSGCGKTTLLRMVAGLELPTEGQVVIGNRDVTYLPPRDRRLSMVFQSYAVFPHKRVRDNIGFGLAMRHVPGDQIRAKVAWAADLLRLTDYLDRYPSQLSGGQRQRVAVARAIVVDADVLLMDEPLSNLDALLRLSFRAELKKLVGELGTTTLYVTHDQTEAMTLGDRVAVMRGGHLQQVGPPKELYNDPVNLFVAGFIGSPAMNFVSARIEDGKLRLPFGDVPIEGRLKERLAESNGSHRDVIAGVRPEHFEDARFAPEIERPLKFRVNVDVVEEMGSELYAFFSVKAGQVHARDLEELEEDAGAAALGHGSGETVAVARLSSESDARAGTQTELVLDTDKITVFAPDGRNLMRAES